MKILIVDNSSSMRRRTGRTLGEAVGSSGELSILEAEDLASALEMLASTALDLVLANWWLPRADGSGFLAAVRAQGHRQPVGFMASRENLAAESEKEILEQARRAGAAFLLFKPLKVQDLAKVLEACGPA